MTKENGSLPSTPVSAKQLPFGINRSLLPIKAYYFLGMAAMGVLLPFLPLYMLQLGLSSTETGIIFCIITFIGTFTLPLSGALADKFRCHKFVLIAATVASGVLFLLLLTVPKRSSTQAQSMTTNFYCSNQNSFFQECPLSSQHDCHGGLSHLANAISEKGRNNSLPTKCSFICRSEQEFDACFSNNSRNASYHTCDRMLKSDKKIDFIVENIQTLLGAKEMEQNKEHGALYYLTHNVMHKGEAGTILCNEPVTLKCVMDCGLQQIPEELYQSYDQTLLTFFFIFLLANLVLLPIVPILDAVAYDALGDQGHKWGQQRVWGSLGHAAFAVASTFSMHYLSQENEDIDFSYSFYIFGVLCILSAIVAYYIQFSSQMKCGQVMKNVWLLFAHPEVTTFLLVVTFFGITHGSIELFCVWFLAGLGSDPLVYGFKLVSSCAAELPMFWISSAIVKKIGTMPCLYLALVGYICRFLAYSFLIDPWLVLLVDPLHGVTFALMYAAATSYASVIAPAGMSATLQGLMYGALFGLGRGVGSLVTGVMFEGLGPRWTWRLFSIMSAIVLVIYFLLNKFVFDLKSKRETPSANQIIKTGSSKNDTADSHKALVSPFPSEDITVGTTSDAEDHTFILLQDKARVCSEKPRPGNI